MAREQRQIVKGSARRLKSIRRRLNLTQPQFAADLGVASNTVARWERGDLEPPRVAELAAEYLLLTREKGEVR